jgi:hypothetical protein
MCVFHHHRQQYPQARHQRAGNHHIMTTRLEQAFAEASKLPPTEQDAVADWLIAELDSVFPHV